jgi:hypothetical protein
MWNNLREISYCIWRVPYKAEFLQAGVGDVMEDP